MTKVLLLQMVMAAAAFVALTLWPPSYGNIILIPLTKQDVGKVASAAIAGDAALLASGPFPGSVVVVGDRAKIERQITTWGIIMVAAPEAACGSNEEPA